VCREHEAEDDRVNEKLHMDAVAGKLRAKKRNHGVGLDDSDEEDSDEEGLRKLRRGMNKKQKVDRDNIKALGQCYWLIRSYNTLDTYV
jgi:MRC1-like domain.